MTLSESERDEFLYRNGLCARGASPVWTMLAGGVSSDVWRVDLPTRAICVKRALARLKVESDWRAPVSRNAYEWKWLEFAASVIPHNVPEPLAADPDAGMFAMSFLDPDAFPVWKVRLMLGNVDQAAAATVGRLLARVHGASAGQDAIAQAFDTTENFYALRLEPYFEATAAHHPDVAAVLKSIVAQLSGTRIALVHGDISPKNILLGAHGPVFLDAECAWYGDPAFDIAFCLNHLLLKCFVQPSRMQALSAAFEALCNAYLNGVSWESAAQIDARAAVLLPALLLARVDGRSPVEYITDDAAKNVLRQTAEAMLLAPEDTLTAVRDRWHAALGKFYGKPDRLCP